MEEFTYTDHDKDAIRILPRPALCQQCGPGSVILWGAGAATGVHLPLMQQQKLMQWLHANLVEYVQDTETAPPTFEPEMLERPGGYLFDVEIGDAKISISDSVNLDAFQMSALIRAATDGLDKLVNGNGEEGDSEHALFLEQLAETLGYKLDEPQHAGVDLLSAVRALAFRIDKQETAIQQLHDQRGQLERDLSKAQAEYRVTSATLGKIRVHLQRAPKSAHVGSDDMSDRVRALVEAAQHLAAVRNELARYAPVGPPSGDAAALRHLLQTQRETIAQADRERGDAIRDAGDREREVAVLQARLDEQRELTQTLRGQAAAAEREIQVLRTQLGAAREFGRERDVQASRGLVLERALRGLRGEFTNSEGMPVGFRIEDEGSAEIVQRIDEALGA